jgi:hypothetical protein
MLTIGADLRHPYGSFRALFLWKTREGIEGQNIALFISNKYRVFLINARFGQYRSRFASVRQRAPACASVRQWLFGRIHSLPTTANHHQPPCRIQSKIVVQVPQIVVYKPRGSWYNRSIEE